MVGQNDGAPLDPDSAQRSMSLPATMKRTMVLPRNLLVLAAAALWLTAGCVTTADCDEHVGCPDGELCYQSQCLVECDEDESCGDDQWCAPCDQEGQNHCLGEEGSVCVQQED